MDNFRKLILIPEERIKQFEYERLSELDRLMHDILRKKNLDDSEKVALYQQVLQKYVKFSFSREDNRHLSDKRNEFTEKPPENHRESESFESDKVKTEVTNSPPSEVSPQSDDIVKQIIHSAPPRFKATAKGIIDFIQQPNSSLLWSPDKELVVKGKVIRNTNILDLINYLIRDRKIKPHGHNIFHAALSENKFPISFVKNKYLKSKTMYAKPISWEAF